MRAIIPLVFVWWIASSVTEATQRVAAKAIFFKHLRELVALQQTDMPSPFSGCDMSGFLVLLTDHGGRFSQINRKNAAYSALLHGYTK
ncbi:hypothetical protein AA0483_0878 [Acetobacter syzygii NRIC 0483]|nr:hypothetical protein AA0483_0878 [Acetobacter syzygii NRIC 0483]